MPELFLVHLDGFPAPNGMPRFLEELPSNMEPWLLVHLESDEPFSEEERERPCFAGVDLTIGEAYALIARLRQTGVSGYLVPVRYRTPRLSVEEALPIAEAALREHISRDCILRSFRFEPMRLNSAFSTPMFRVFEAYSRTWMSTAMFPPPCPSGWTRRTGISGILPATGRA